MSIRAGLSKYGSANCKCWYLGRTVGGKGLASMNEVNRRRTNNSLQVKGGSPVWSGMKKHSVRSLTCVTGFWLQTSYICMTFLTAQSNTISAFWCNVWNLRSTIQQCSYRVLNITTIVDTNNSRPEYYSAIGIRHTRKLCLCFYIIRLIQCSHVIRGRTRCRTFSLGT